MLQYSLEPFAAADQKESGKPTYVARVANAQTIKEKELVKRLAERNNLGEGVVHAVLSGLRREVELSLAEGNRVNLDGFIQFFPTLQGTFDDYNGRRDPKRHKISVSTRPSPRLNKDINYKNRWQRVHKRQASPIIHTIKAFGEEEGLIQPGNILTLHGNHLKCDPKQLDEGVFLISAKGKRPPLRIDCYGPVQPKSLMFQMPKPLPTGEYLIEVRARRRNASFVQSGQSKCLIKVSPKGAKLIEPDSRTSESVNIEQEAQHSTSTK